MKIALVQCPSWTTISPPYSLSLLSACLRKAGHDVSCHDLNIKLYNYSKMQGEDKKWEILEATSSWYSYKDVLDIINRYESYIDLLVNEILENDPDIVGFSITFVSRIFSEEIAKRIKQKKRNAIIVFGGFMCFRCEWGIGILECPSVDAICFLEGEIAFVNLVNTIEANNGKLAACKGFAYRDVDGHIIDCGDYPLIDNLDSIPYADFSDFDLEEYTQKTLPIATSRGCFNRCTFCVESVIYKKYRCRQADNIFQEMTFQLRKHPQIKTFYFNDSLINGNMGILDKLCDLIILNKFNVTWGGNLFICEKLDFAFLKKMREAGFDFAGLGLESGSPRILERMNKNQSPSMAKDLIRNMKGLGIRVHANLVVGFPGESEEDVSKTVEFLEETIDCMEQVNFHPYVVLPKTFVDDHKQEFGVVIPEDNNKVRWHSPDYSNSFEVRQKRLAFYRERFGEKIRLGNL